MEKQIKTPKMSKIRLTVVVFSAFIAITFVVISAVYFAYNATYETSRNRNTPVFKQAPKEDYIKSLATTTETLDNCGANVSISKAYAITRNSSYAEFPELVLKDESFISYGRASNSIDSVFVYCSEIPNEGNIKNKFSKVLLDHRGGSVKVEKKDLPKDEVCKLLTLDSKDCQSIKSHDIYTYTNFEISPGPRILGLKLFPEVGTKDVISFETDKNIYIVTRQYKFPTDIIYLPELDLR